MNKKDFKKIGSDEWSRDVWNDTATGINYVDVEGDGVLYSITEWGEPIAPIGVTVPVDITALARSIGQDNADRIVLDALDKIALQRGVALDDLTETETDAAPDKGGRR